MSEQNTTPQQQEATRQLVSAAASTDNKNTVTTNNESSMLPTHNVVATKTEQRRAKRYADNLTQLAVVNNDYDSLNNSPTNMPLWQAFAIMVLTVLLVSFIKYDRLLQYWQQSYPQLSAVPQLLSGYEQTPVAKIGLSIEHALSAPWLAPVLNKSSELSNGWVNHTFYQPVLDEQARQVKIKAQQALERKRLLAKQQAERQQAQLDALKPKPLTHAVISSQQKVFFAGDSLMEGVAPWAMRKLKTEYNIDSIDLSKQNTGLSYSSFYDWPATIENTLEEHADVGIMVMFIGANDPWAVPDPANPGGQYIDFATPYWNELYTAKIKRILQAAKQHNVQVIWMTPPNMKRQKLAKEMQTLNQLYHQSISDTQAVVFDTWALLQPKDDDTKYSDSIYIDGKLTKVRTSDGIHFTIAGQKQLANAILAHINVQD